MHKCDVTFWNDLLVSWFIIANLFCVIVTAKFAISDSEIFTEDNGRSGEALERRKSKESERSLPP